MQVVVTPPAAVSPPPVPATTAVVNPIRSLALAASATALLAGPAQAAVPHTVMPGETLWTIASANNLTNRALAAFNGLSAEGNVILGSTVMIPTPAEAAGAMAKAGMTPTNPPVSGSTATSAAPAATSTATPAATVVAAPASGAAPKPMGGYTVRWGDTLALIASRAGVPVSHIAAMNGLDPAKVLLAGTVLKLPTGASTPATTAPAPATKVVPPAAPNPTPTRVDASTIQQIAAAHGVPGSLAAAIAWQESGFNNGMVSSANARGVMQVMPGTWDWIQQNLTRETLDPNSATDNVHAGVHYLGHLLKQTGGDTNTAIASYYQGLGSVRSRGMYDDTKQYVSNVQALRGRFGGP